MERVFFGAIKHTHGADKDLNLREVVVLLPLIVLIFWMGIAPKPFLNLLERPAETLLLKLSDERDVLMVK